ncbi:MAG: tRNA uridine-5-carboxymethylaminomethyl(34) synthesis enzyme MnmG [Nannocystis sp.]|nr:tRNA uridine-5-carboxymethylaminomethyl(34) synthesis enzyme MnmG [Nannocystis sp.]
MRGPTLIVVGAGHAGLEAAFAAARVFASRGAEGRVLVVTGSTATAGQTPCNPSVGGVAKGHVVKEIDALGGYMGRAADTCAIHGRTLNESKGPAVQATRVQVDKARYGALARASLASARGIEVVEGMVVDLLVGTGPKVQGVRLADGSEIAGAAVVVTTGTFLGGVLHTGREQAPGGRVGEAPAVGLSERLRALGFSLRRLKTGTPARIDGRTIHWEDPRLELQPSESPLPRFTLPDEAPPPILPQRACFITWTGEATHALVRARLHESAMYSGAITGRGPRYCPSIEDKIVRFADRERHQIFLEPEGLETDSVYPNGISTSLPAAAQAAMIQTIAGLERAVMLRPGYAVEYDAVDARALDHGLGCPALPGLFFAGQINGTSGYEEAAGQGLVAGANAALGLVAAAPLRIGRDEGYIGVMVDDLITQGCDEPYRLFTSRAEHRMILREDNADQRLSEMAFRAGLIDEARWARALARGERVAAAGRALGRGGEAAEEAWIVRRAQAERCYAGYVEAQRREIARIRGDEGHALAIPATMDFFGLPGLSYESAERLARVRPTCTSQAARIPGMTPAALSCLWTHVRAAQRRGAG